MPCVAVKSGDHSFYSLLGTEPNYKESPKLDGLSLNFLMNKSEFSAAYVDVVKGLLKIGEMKLPENEPVVNYVQYFVYKLMLALPPPCEFLEYMLSPQKIFQGNFFDSPATVLYMTLWIHRISHKAYAAWIKVSFFTNFLVFENKLGFFLDLES